MPTEITHVDLRSSYPIAFALGAVNGVFVSLPMVWHWIETGEWITGYEMGGGLFAIGIGLSILTTAITTAIVAVVFVVAYNVVAERFGGIEVRLET